MALEVEVCDVVESISKAWNDEPTVPAVTLTEKRLPSGGGSIYGTSSI
jgi:hypothetical protein